MIYTNPQVVKFVKDMKRANIYVEHYHGRYHWQGPAVTTNDDYPTLQDVYGATKVKLQRDSLGLHEIIYPVADDAGTEE